MPDVSVWRGYCPVPPAFACLGIRICRGVLVCRRLELGLTVHQCISSVKKLNTRVEKADNGN